LNSRAYNLQDQGLDTVQANIVLGHEIDSRDFTIAASILEDLGIQRVYLMTNNPEKVLQIQTQGIHVEERIPLITEVKHPDAMKYIYTKAIKLAHDLSR
jgi:GTP cyclohydrolase II